MKYIPKTKYRLFGGFLRRRFNLHARNGQIILTSQSYLTERGRRKGILSIAVNSQIDERFKRLMSKDGQLYFNLVARNNRVIGTSQMYNSKQAMEKGILSVRDNGFQI